MAGSDLGQLLLDAAKAGDASQVRSLIDHNANVNQGNDFNDTPLHWACQGGHGEVACMSIDHGANVNQCTDYYNATQYNAMQYNTIQYNTIQSNTIQSNTIQYNQDHRKLAHYIRTKVRSIESACKENAARKAVVRDRASKDKEANTLRHEMSASMMPANNLVPTRSIEVDT
jgi:ankyrin repeat protein